MAACFKFPVVLTSLLALALAACGDEIQLTPKPLVGAADATSAAPVATELAVTVTLDRGRLAAGIAQALDGVGRRVSMRVDDAACAKGATRTVCRPAAVKALITAKGDVSLTAGPTGLLSAAIPIAYRMEIAGTGRARHRSDVLIGETVVSVGFALALDPGRMPVVTRSGPVTAIPARLPVLDGSVDVGTLVSEALEDSERALEREIASAVTLARPIEALERAWVSVQAPMSFALKGARTAWLRARPQSVASIGFASEDGELVVTSKIAAQVEVGSGEAGNVEIAAPMPPGAVPSQTVADSGTMVVVPVAMDLAAFKQRIADALPPGAKLRTRAAPTSAEVELEIRETRVTSAQRFIAVTVVAEVLSPPRLAGQVGNVNLVARPELHPVDGTIRLTGLSFPVVSDPDATAATRPVPVGIEPLRSIIERVARIPVLDAWAAELAESATIEAEVAQGLKLSADFDRVEPVGAAASGRGLDVLVALHGRFVLRYRPQGLASAAHADRSGRIPRIGEIAKR